MASVDSLEERARKFLEPNWYLDRSDGTEEPVLKDCVDFARAELEAIAKLAETKWDYECKTGRGIAAAIRAYAAQKGE